MTADFLTRPLPIERFGLVYASAQKNLGAAGLTIVIVDENLLGKSKRKVPPPLDYAHQASASSKVNTPPTFAIVVALRMLQWLRQEGGLDAAAAKNIAKSKELYAVIDESDFYRCFASPRDRSTISICFRLPIRSSINYSSMKPNKLASCTSRVIPTSAASAPVSTMA